MARALLALLTAAAAGRGSAADPAPAPSLRGRAAAVAAPRETASEAGAAVPESNVSSLAAWWHGSCRVYGCVGFRRWHRCQCNSGCQRYGNCCHDYWSRCAPRPPAPVPTPAPAPAPAPAPPAHGSDAATYTFYMYRAQSDASYPPLNVNTANLEGVTWYLQHEVVVESPPKFGITRVLRYKVQTKAPARLLAAGMNFGVRFAYDSGKCTGPGDCVAEYAKYGYFVGCNKFTSMYPYPDEPTGYPEGVWYSLPGNGTVCAGGVPTGQDRCTYTYSWPPDEVALDDLIGDWQAFFSGDESESANQKKVEALAALFRKKYPGTEDLREPKCDFDYGKFWR